MPSHYEPYNGFGNAFELGFKGVQDEQDQRRKVAGELLKSILAQHPGTFNPGEVNQMVDDIVKNGNFNMPSTRETPIQGPTEEGQDSLGTQKEPITFKQPMYKLNEQTGLLEQIDAPGISSGKQVIHYKPPAPKTGGGGKGFQPTTMEEKADFNFIQNFDRLYSKRGTKLRPEVISRFMKIAKKYGIDTTEVEAGSKNNATDTTDTETGGQNVIGKLIEAVRSKLKGGNTKGPDSTGGDTAGTVRVTDSTGKVWNIPKANLQKAKQQDPGLQETPEE